ncbi:growth/differentiation factor 6-A-like [Sphaeramia orbicularis]|uniref:growth/differentiation factor 6-A-like n=1 Tax=Sphaeramia orbicularis TaxID=375764 RepID=UPI00117BE9D2|nr:growth/differentiation factor 6-A-like [Sphaeramia orbicularis]
MSEGGSRPHTVTCPGPGLFRSHLMDRAVASVLCFAVCVGLEGTGVLWSGSDPSVVHTHPEHINMDQTGNRTVVLHEYMLFLYQTLSEVQQRDRESLRDPGFANTVRSFVDKGKDEASWESGQHYMFDLSTLTRTDQLVEAKLRILRKPLPDPLAVLRTGGNLYVIRLYSCSTEDTSETKPLGSHTVEALDGGLPRWEVFDVLSSMRAYQKNPTQPTQACFYLLALSELTNEMVDPLLLGLGRHARPPQDKALLVSFTHADTHGNLLTEIMDKRRTETGGFRLTKRVRNTVKHNKKQRGQNKRALSKRSSKKTGRKKPRCSRKALNVSFKDLGWDDWIIAPQNYEANHCDGVCDFPLRSHLEPTNHAVIQTLMNSLDPGISPPSCCIPSRLSPISILYVDSGNNVVYKQYEDMVVESCACR